MPEHRLSILGAFAVIAAIFISLGLGAYWGALHVPQYFDRENGEFGKYIQAEDRDISQLERDRAGLPYFAEKFVSGSDPKNLDEINKRELAAQESSAVWSFWLLAVSIFSTVITFLGTGILLWQISLTRRAVEDTSKATKAMERQNELADQAQRPWLEIDLEFDFLSKIRGGFLLATTVKLRNIGQMPAYHAKIDNFMIQRYRNPIYDFQVAAEMPWEEGRIYESDLIVLPGGTAQDQELIYLIQDEPAHQFDDGVIPQVMITVRYELPDGRDAQTSAWFIISMPSDAGGSAMIPWDWEPNETRLSVQPCGYIRVT